MRLLEGQYKFRPGIENGIISFTVSHGEEFLPGFVSGFPLRLISVGLRRPTLEDVFLKLTGRTIRQQEVDSVQQMKNMARMRRH